MLVGQIFYLGIFFFYQESMQLFLGSAEFIFSFVLFNLKKTPHKTSVILELFSVVAVACLICRFKTQKNPGGTE